MALAQVAIVGRPNVGKSSLFNWIAGRRIAIVDPTPGVTRDRLVAPIEVGDNYFELVDTGGMGILDIDNLTLDVERQIDHAMREATVILFVVDTRSGIVPLDELVASRLRGIGKPIVLVANKSDETSFDAQAAEFHQLGFGDVLCVSALQHRGRHELLQRILEHLPISDAPPPSDPNAWTFKLAIVGKRNTGKSTFINCLAEGDRTIVSEVEGTTRDSVDVLFQRDGKTILAIDTAGVRYRGAIKTNVDFYSLARAERSIRRADVVLHFLDATKNISHVDKQLAGYVLEQYRPAIFVVNKWDLAQNMATGEYADYLRKVFPNLDFVPVAFITAKDGKNVDRVLGLAESLHKQASSRVGTGDLNRVVQRAITQQSPPMRQNRQGKVYYSTQVATNPPTIVLFTNGPQLFDKTYQRYLIKMFRDHLPFSEVAIKMYLRQKESTAPGADEAKSHKSKKIQPRSRRKDKEVGEVWQDV